MFPTTRDPLHAIERVVQFLIFLIGLTFLVGLPLAASGIVDNLSFGAVNNDIACVTTPVSTFPQTDTGISPSSEYGQVMGLQPGGTVQATHFEVCNLDPQLRDAFTATIAQTMPLIFFLSVMIALQWVIAGAAREGLFSSCTANRTWAIGWFLVVGSMLAELLRQAMIGATLSGVVDDISWRSTLLAWDFPYVAVITGIGILSLGRVLARAVVLQQEQDATI